MSNLLTTHPLTQYSCLAQCANKAALPPEGIRILLEDVSDLLPGVMRSTIIF